MMCNKQNYCLICCVLFLFFLHAGQVLCQMTLFQTFIEENPPSSTYFGWCVSDAGDVNNDGYDDIIIGGYGYNSETGRAYVFLGGTSMDTNVDITLTGENTGDQFAFSVACAGDVNNDGYDDVIVGARAYNSDTGRAYVYHGGPWMDNTADVILTGEGPDDHFGRSVSCAGDVNNDGYDDVIVGASAFNYNGGRAYVYHGGLSMDQTVDVTLYSETFRGNYGWSVSSAGDVNNDGYDDVIVGAPLNMYYHGHAYIYYGGTSMDYTADVSLTGEETSDQFGISVSGAGDVNSDGYDDVIVGAPLRDSDTGYAYVYCGGISMDNAADVTMTGEHTVNWFGFKVSDGGDVNNDGYNDVIVAAPVYNSEIGRVYIFFGGSSMDITVDAIMTGEDTSNCFGWSVSGAGDVNNDGYAEVIIGANNGKAYVYTLEAPSTITQQVTIQNSKLNLISLNVIPKTPDASAVFDGLTNFVVAFNDDGEYRIPPNIVFPGHPGTNTIGDVDPCEGYSIFISGGIPQDLSVTGIPIDAAALVCTVDNGKLNKTSFPKQNAQPIADVFNATVNAALWPDLVVVFDDEGQYFIPPNIVFPGHPGTNTIGDMLPGKGYSLYHSGDAPINYTYPEGSGSAPLAKAKGEQPVTEADHFSFVKTGEPHAVFLRNEGLMLEKGDELAVFAGEHCVGAMKYEGSLDNPLVIWRAVPEHGLSGIKKGDNLTLRHWMNQTDEVEEVSVEGDIYFDESRQFSVLTLTGSLTPEGINKLSGIVPDRMELYQNYPNPFNPSTTIRFDISSPSDVTVVIYNIQGRVVSTLVDELMSAGQYELKWDGCGELGNRVGSGVYFIHLKAGEFSFTRKLLLVQ